MSAGPWDGLRVVEFGQFVVVPFAAQMMADCGADVVKVEPPSGDSYRAWDDGLGETESRQFLIKNRGKRSVSVDLSHRDAPEVVRALVETADVVLVNLSPAALRRRGLDYETVRRIRPDVVYASVSAFGRRGPEASLPGMDVVVQARSGLVGALGAERDGVPRHSEVQVSDYATAMLLFGAVATALLVRERTGAGQEVDLSLMAGALAMQNNALSHVPGHDEWRETFVHEDLPRLRAGGADREEVERLRRAGRSDRPLHTSHYRVYRARDGFLAIGAGSSAARHRLAALVGLDREHADDHGAVGDAVEAAMPTRAVREWVDLLRGDAVPAAPVHHVEEMFFDPHVLDQGLLVDYEHESVGRYRALGPLFGMSATPLPGTGASPAFAAHTHDVLVEAGVPTDTVAAWTTSGAVTAAQAQPSTRSTA